MMPEPFTRVLWNRIGELEAALTRLADRVDALERADSEVARLNVEVERLQQELRRKTALLGVP
jgi:small-conductance mechanosensitive channel